MKGFAYIAKPFIALKRSFRNLLSMNLPMDKQAMQVNKQSTCNTPKAFSTGYPTSMSTFATAKPRTPWMIVHARRQLHSFDTRNIPSSPSHLGFSISFCAIAMSSSSLDVRPIMQLCLLIFLARVPTCFCMTTRLLEFDGPCTRKSERPVMNVTRIDSITHPFARATDKTLDGEVSAHVARRSPYAASNAGQLQDGYDARQ